MAKRDPSSDFRVWLPVLAAALSASLLPATSPAAMVRFDPALYVSPESSGDLRVVMVLVAGECPGLVRIPESTAVLRPIENAAAAAGSDFSAAERTIPLGLTGASPIFIERVVSGLILDDEIPEDVEVFGLELDLGDVPPPTCVPIDPGDFEPFELALSAGPAASVLIEDDEPPVMASIDGVSAAEGDSGTTAFAFTVSLAAPAPIPLEVAYATADGTATAGSDYEAGSGSVSFVPGETSQSLSVLVTGDRVPEDDETFFVDLSTGTPGVVVATGRGTGTILNDDEGPAGTVSIDDISLAEGNSGTTAFVFTVSLTPPATVPVTVRFATADGTATTADGDYQTARGSVTFAPGTGTRRIPVTVTGDGRDEDDETFFVDLTLDTPGFALGKRRGTGTIRDDDDPSQGSVVSGDGQTGVVNLPLPEPLVVRVTGDGQRPVSGVRVVWSVVQGVASLGREESLTDAEGLATNTVVLGARPGEVVVEARAAGVDTVFRFVLTAVLTVVDGLDDTERPVAVALDQICRRQTLSDGLRTVCDDFGRLAAGQQRTALRAIAPEEASAQGTAAAEAQRDHLSHVGDRLAALRGGAGRAASTQVALRLGGVALGHEQLAGLFKAGHDRPRLAWLLDARPQDADDEPRAPAQPAGTADFGERLGFFVNGSLGKGDRPATRRESGFDFDTLAVTAGVDYRLRGGGVLGGALGFHASDAELDAGGDVDSEGYSLTAFGMWSKERFYVDASVLFGRTSFDTRRAIDFPGRSRVVAAADPDGDQLGVGLGGGFDRGFGALSLGAAVRLDYLATDVDGYRETGAGGFNLAIDGQEVESLVAALRLQLTYAVSVENVGVVLPTLRLGYLHELEDPARLIVARFVDDPGGTRFAVPTDEPDRDYLDVGAGFTAVFRRGRQAYLFFEKDLERDDLDYYRFTFGLRFPF